jgi:hypothetical protein
MVAQFLYGYGELLRINDQYEQAVSAVQESLDVRRETLPKIIIVYEIHIIIWVS